MPRAAFAIALALLAATSISAPVAAAGAAAAPEPVAVAEPLPATATAAAPSCDPAADDLEWLGGFNFCEAETTCQLGGPISCQGFSQCQEQYQCWVWCDGYLQYCPGVSPQYCPVAPPEY